MIRLSSRRIVEVKGPQACDFLQNIVTQDMSKSAFGFASLLTPQGKITAEFLFTRNGDSFLLDVASSAAEALIKRLSAYKLRASVAIAMRDDLAVSVDADTPAAAADPRLEALGRRLIGAAGSPADVDAELRWRRRRFSLGVAEIGDFEPDSVFLTDVNYDRLYGVDYRKGCFVGQEVTSRMKRKGDIRRRTFVLRYVGAAPPPQGAAIEAGGVEVGTVLVADGGVGLAIFRTDRLAAADSKALTVAGISLQLEVPSYMANS